MNSILLKSKFFLLFVFIIFFQVNGWAQSSIDINQKDPTNHYIEFLIGQDLIRTAIIGIRPYSRQEIARLVIEARKNFEDKKKSFFKKRVDRVGEVLKKLEKSFVKDIQIYKGEVSNNFEITYLKKINAEVTFLDNNTKTLRDLNGTGWIDATLNSIVQNNQGRDYIDGAQYSIETEHSAQLSPYMSLYFQPRFQAQFPFGATNDNIELQIQELYADLKIANIELQIGRSTLMQGQTSHGGIIFSDNARPLDHIHLTNDHPFRLPWIFKHLGDQKIMAYWGTLGPEANFSYTQLVGYKWMMKPFWWWEFGISNTVVFGGDGSPNFSVDDIFFDFIGFSATTVSTSNRIIGMDQRFTLPFLRNSQFYFEVFFDDKTIESFKRTFVDTAAYIFGLNIPRITDDGRIYGLLEFRFFGETMYRHSQFTSGYTINREFIGDPIGPDSVGFLIMLGCDINDNLKLNFETAYELRDDDTYSNSGYSIVSVINRPIEKRMRFLVGADYQYNDRVSLLAKMGYEYVTSFNHFIGDNRNHFLAQVGITIDLENKLNVGIH